MKKILFALSCLHTILTFSQELVKNVSLDLPKKTDVFQIIEEEKKEISLFFCDKTRVRCLRFDSQFSIVDSIIGNRPSDLYDNIVGYSTSKNNYYTYWSNANNREILAQSFDFNTKKVAEKSFQIEFEKERVLSKITIDNIFYLITIVKNSSLLNFYVFNDGNMNRKSVDLSTKRFLDEENKSVPLWELISRSTDFEPPFHFQTISSDTPPSLVFSAYKRKLYPMGNTLVFSMDTNPKFTQTFTINLPDFSVTQKVYSQPYFEERIATKSDNPEKYYSIGSSNSCLLKDVVAQIKTVDNITKIVVKNRAGEELKSFRISEFEDISFKNSEIYQENGYAKGVKILDKSNKFARKIDGLNPSLSLYQPDDKIRMVVGGVSLFQNNDAIMIGGMIGGFTGALMGAALTSNYTMNSINSYNNRKVIYINCLFDNNFNHLDGEVAKTGFDQLRVFVEDRMELTKTITFKLNNNLFFGGYDDRTKEYSFYKFSE